MFFWTLEVVALFAVLILLEKMEEHKSPLKTGNYFWAVYVYHQTTGNILKPFRIFVLQEYQEYKLLPITRVKTVFLL